MVPEEEKEFQVGEPVYVLVSIYSETDQEGISG